MSSRQGLVIALLIVLCALATAGISGGPQKIGAAGGAGIVRRAVLPGVGCDSCGPAPVAMVAAGFEHTCALQDSGAVSCWGRNFSGELGNGTNGDTNSPVSVKSLSSGVIAISVGGHQSCALLASGAVKCWGMNMIGPNPNNRTETNVPVAIAGLEPGARGISVGGYHACALLLTGEVKCWGANDKGQLGSGDTTGRATPVSVEGLTRNAVAISAGLNHTCALLDDGAVKCWGWNSDGQLGTGNALDAKSPTEVTGLGGKVAEISAGQYHTCALVDLGTVKCWGRNGDGQLGSGNSSGSTAPMETLPLGARAIKIDTGGWHTCAILETGAAKCWGRNSDGQLGNGSNVNSSTPVSVSGGANGLLQLATGHIHTCAVQSGGAVRCWGNNFAGALGDGGNSSSTVPVAVRGLDLSPD